MKKCSKCGQTKPISRGTKCAACVKKAQRSHNEPMSTPNAPDVHTPTHAIRCDETTPGAVKRSLPMGRLEWVIPGGHYVGDIWTDCLNPACKTGL